MKRGFYCAGDVTEVLTSSGLNPNGGSARNLAKSNSDVVPARPLFPFPFAHPFPLAFPFPSM